MSVSKSIILITGANSGIGLELASQLLSDASKHVLVGSRSVQKGESAVKDLLAQGKPGTAEFLQVDLDSDESIAAAAKSVESKHGRLDALVNNAALGGIGGGASESLSKSMAALYRTNVIGPQLMGEAFTSLLEKSKGTPRIVNVSSALGSINLRLDAVMSAKYKAPPDYRASKAALDMITADQAMLLGEKGFKVFAYCPGFTVSNLGSYNTAANGAKPTSEGSAPLVNILNGERDAEHGTFLHEGGQHPW